MKRKNIAGLIAIVAIVAAAMLAGCIEEGGPTSIPLDVTPTPTPIVPEVTPTPTPELTLSPTQLPMPIVTPTPTQKPEYVKPEWLKQMEESEAKVNADMENGTLPEWIKKLNDNFDTEFEDALRGE